MALAADSKVGHQLGITQAKSHALALHDLRRQVVETGDRVRGVLSPSLAALGVSGLSAAAGLTAVAAAIKRFCRACWCRRQFKSGCGREGMKPAASLFA